MIKKFKKLVPLIIVPIIVICLVLAYLSWKEGWLTMFFHPPEEVIFEDLLLKEDELQKESVVLEGFLLKSKNLTIFTEKINVEDGKIKSTGAAIWVEDERELIRKVLENLKKEERMGKMIYYGKVRLAGQFFCQEKWKCEEEIEEGKGYGYLGAYGCQIVPARIKILEWEEN